MPPLLSPHPRLPILFGNEEDRRERRMDRDERESGDRTELRLKDVVATARSHTVENLPDARRPTSTGSDWNGNTLAAPNATRKRPTTQSGWSSNLVWIDREERRIPFCALGHFPLDLTIVGTITPYVQHRIDGEAGLLRCHIMDANRVSIRTDN